jgi:hypothetical protein
VLGCCSMGRRERELGGGAASKHQKVHWRCHCGGGRVTCKPGCICPTGCAGMVLVWWASQAESVWGGAPWLPWGA